MKSGSASYFVNKVLLKTATFINFHRVNDCFGVTTADVSWYNRNHMTHKTENICHLDLYRQTLLTLRPELRMTTSVVIALKHKILNIDCKLNYRDISKKLWDVIYP